jgi:hypothetical protein
VSFARPDPRAARDSGDPEEGGVCGGGERDLLGPSWAAPDAGLVHLLASGRAVDECHLPAYLSHQHT